MRKRKRIVPTTNSRSQRQDLRTNGKSGVSMAVMPSGELEILLYGEIGSDAWTGTGITANTVREQMDAAGSYSRIVARINSPGGDAFEGVAIGNVLRSSGKRVQVIVDGIAASAASIIAMSGNTITMASNAMMMIHNAWAFCMGDADEMHKMGDTLKKISTSIAQTYAQRTGMPVEEIVALMDAETWLNAEDCLAKGFATAIAEESNESAMAMARKFKALSRLKRVPSTLLAASVACECKCSDCKDGRCDECSEEDCDDANCTDCPESQNVLAPPQSTSDLSLRQAQLWLLQNAITTEGLVEV